MVGRLLLLRDHRVLRASLSPLFMIHQKDHLERSNHDRTLTKQGQALISEVDLSARQLIELGLELGATTSIQASAETLTHRKPNNVPFVQEPNFSAIEDEFEDDF